MDFGTQEEHVTSVYKEGVLVAIIKRDVKTRKHLVYMLREAKTEDIVRLITKLNEE